MVMIDQEMPPTRSRQNIPSSISPAEVTMPTSLLPPPPRPALKPKPVTPLPLGFLTRAAALPGGRTGLRLGHADLAAGAEAPASAIQRALGDDEGRQPVGGGPRGVVLGEAVAHLADPTAVPLEAGDAIGDAGHAPGVDAEARPAAGVPLGVEGAIVGKALYAGAIPGFGACPV